MTEPELSALKQIRITCDDCEHKIVFEPDVYGTETDGSIDALFEGDEKGDWVTLGFIDCYASDDDVDKCIDEIEKSGMADAVMNYVIDTMKRIFEAHGIKVKLVNKPLFYVNAEDLRRQWLYLVRGNERLRCTVFIEGERSDEPGVDDVISFEVGMVCQ